MRKYMIGIWAVMLVAVSVFAANEITANMTLKVTKGYLDITRTQASTFTLTNASPNVAGMTQLIPTNTVGTALTLGNVAVNGVAWFKNLGTNASCFIEIGTQDGSSVFWPLVRLQVGEAWPIRLAIGAAPYARAGGTNAVNSSLVLEKLIFDN
jgi:hypothetical protein